MVIQVKVVDVLNGEVRKIKHGDAQYKREEYRSGPGPRDYILKKKGKGLYADDAIARTCVDEVITEIEFDNGIFTLIKHIQKTESKTEAEQKQIITVCAPEHLVKKAKEIKQTENDILNRTQRKKDWRVPNNLVCPHCKKDDALVTAGYRNAVEGKRRIFKCNNCNKRFTPFPPKKKPRRILAALDLYNEGEALQRIAKHIEGAYGKLMTGQTIGYWVKKYNKIIKSDIRFAPYLKENEDKEQSRLPAWNVLSHEIKFDIARRIAMSELANK